MRIEALTLSLALTACASQPREVAAPAFCVNSSEHASDWTVMPSAPPVAPQLLARLTRERDNFPDPLSRRSYWLAGPDGKLRFCETTTCDGSIYTFVPDGSTWKRSPTSDEIWVTADCGGRPTAPLTVEVGLPPNIDADPHNYRLERP